MSSNSELLGTLCGPRQDAAPVMDNEHFVTLVSVHVYSGVAKPGHTGARALATGGCAPPVQVLLKIIGAECTVINRKLGAKSAQRC